MITQNFKIRLKTRNKTRAGISKKKRRFPLPRFSIFGQNVGDKKIGIMSIDNGVYTISALLGKKYKAYVNGTNIDESLEVFFNLEWLGPVLGGEEFIASIRDKLDTTADETSRIGREKLTPTIEKINIECLPPWYWFFEAR